MKKIVVLVTVLMGLGTFDGAYAGSNCSRIKDGIIIDDKGNVISVGYDKWGYNYQAHMFNGLYGNSSRPMPPVSAGDVNLTIKWSDNWLSNQDCDHDGQLDRGGDGSGISKGWLTNHEEGDYLGDDGEYHHFTYFVKIVYDGGAACISGRLSCIWDLYTIIQEVYNDPYGGAHGADRSRLVNPAGLGYYMN